MLTILITIAMFGLTVFINMTVSVTSIPFSSVPSVGLGGSVGLTVGLTIPIMSMMSKVSKVSVVSVVSMVSITVVSTGMIRCIFLFTIIDRCVVLFSLQVVIGSRCGDRCRCGFSGNSGYGRCNWLL